MPRLRFLSLQNRRGRTYFLLVIALLSLGWGVYSLVQAVRPSIVQKVRLGAGSQVARRYQIAQYLADEALSDKLAISLVPTKGFDDSVAQVAAGDIETAIVSLGIRPHNAQDIRVLAGLDVAPLHILARRDITATCNSLIDILKNRRINLGKEGTNDHALGSEIIRFLHLADHYTEMGLSKDELTQRADEVIAASKTERLALSQDLPDVVMVVGSIPSSVVQRLLDTTEYDLVPFPYTRNFLMSDTHDRNNIIVRRYVEPIVIPAGMYIGASPIPAQECSSLGLRSLLIARNDLPEDISKELMRTVFESSFAQHIQPLSPEKVVNSDLIHPAALAYFNSKKPLLTGNFFEEFSDVLSVFGAFVAGALSLYSYLRRRRIRSPGEYLEEIRHVDSLVCERESTELDALQNPAAVARELDSRLVKLKQQLIEDYCNNRVPGELVLMSILSLLSDSRAQLQRTAGNTHEQLEYARPIAYDRSRAA